MENIYIAEWLYLILWIIYIVTVIGIILIVLSENRNPLKSLSWIMVLTFLPVGGLILYLFLGRDFRKQRMISKKSFKKIDQYSFDLETKPENISINNEVKGLVQLLKNIGNSKLYSGNEIEVFIDGSSMINELTERIKCATKFIHLQFYIFRNDNAGIMIRDLLIEKAKQGIEVRVMYDDVGCWDVPNSFFNHMKDNGIELNAFFEVRIPVFARKINYRNHRKIAIIDGEYGFIGGMNIADRYVYGLKWGNWRDTHLMIKGPAIVDLQKSFSIDWYFSDKELLWDAKYFPKQKVEGNIAMQIATSGPIGEWKEMMHSFFKAINSAKKYVYIQTPYFLPTESLLIALQTAALSGIDVRIMLPMRSDSSVVHVGSCSYIRSMLISEVKVYFYKPGFLHSKVIIVDDEFCSIGSANMDFRSLEHNFEANAFIYNSEFTIKMRKIFIKDQSLSHKITLREWRSRPIMRKIAESVMRLLAPML